MQPIREILENVPGYADRVGAPCLPWEEFSDQIARIDREEQEKARRGVPVIDLPKRFSRAVIGFPITESQTRAENTLWGWMLPLPSGNAYLHGPSMSGKSHIGCALLRDLAANGTACRYASFVDVVRNSAPGTGNRQELVRQLAATPLLMLDDVAVECGDGTGAVNAMQEWKRELLREIVYNRYNDGAPTLYVSMLNPAQLVMATDGALGRRISQDLAVAL